MKTRRYMVVDHSSEEKLKWSGDRVTGTLCIHSMLLNYHWVRISTRQVFAFGSLSPHHYTELHEHPMVTVLPVINSHKTLVQHLQAKGRPGHLEALRGWGLQDAHTVMDYLEYLEENKMLGPQFIPEV